MFEYMRYVRDLKFDEKPKYKYLLELFEEHMKENDMEIDGNFDWVIQKQLILENKKKAIEDAKAQELAMIEATKNKDTKKTKKAIIANKKLDEIQAKKDAILKEQADATKQKEEKKQKRKEKLEEQKLNSVPPTKEEILERQAEYKRKIHEKID